MIRAAWSLVYLALGFGGDGGATILVGTLSGEVPACWTSEVSVWMARSMVVFYASAGVWVAMMWTSGFGATSKSFWMLRSCLSGGLGTCPSLSGDSSSC